MEDTFINSIGTFFNSVWLTIDGMLYSVVGYLYQVFLMLARAEIFDNDMIRDFTNKIYLIIGVVMLFVVTYSMLRALINPDDLTKGDNAPTKIAGNIIKAVVVIALTPTIFNFAFTLQNAILDNNIIGRLILGEVAGNDTVANNDVQTHGRVLAVESFKAFFYPEEGYVAEDIRNEYENRRTFTLDQAFALAVNSGDFFVFKDYAQKVTNEQIRYMWVLSIAASVFLIYVIFSFCLDLGIRVVKLGFFQIIAPIPAMCLIIPGQKKIFDNWAKKAFATYIEVFIRIVIIFLGLYLISNINSIFENIMNTTDNYTLSFGVPQIVKVLIIFGIVAFMKQAPKLIADIFGLDSGNMKLGIGEKLAAGGALVAAGAVGAGLTAGARNLTSSIKNFDTSSGWGVAKSTLRAMTSPFAGLGAGMVRGGVGNKGSKSAADLKKATGEATAATTAKSRQRAAYRAAHGDNIAGQVTGKLDDAWGGLKDFIGLSDSQVEDRQLEGLNSIITPTKSMQDGWESKDNWKLANEEAGQLKSDANKLGDFLTTNNKYSAAMKDFKKGTLLDDNGQVITDKKMAELHAFDRATEGTSAEFQKKYNQFLVADENVKQQAAINRAGKPEVTIQQLKQIGANMDNSKDLFSATGAINQGKAGADVLNLADFHAYVDSGDIEKAWEFADEVSKRAKTAVGDINLERAQRQYKEKTKSGQ